MKNEFVSYEIALELKELGFDEPCICGYNDYHLLRSKISSSFDGDFVKWDEKYDKDLKAPIYQQVFRWLREQLNWQSLIETTNDQHSHRLGYNYFIWNNITGEMHHSMPKNRPSGDWCYKTYEEAQKECIMDLISIIKIQVK
jgi:hypothetical protein